MRPIPEDHGTETLTAGLWMDKVCVGRGESAGGVGVSAAAGCASRPAPSAVSAGAKCRVGRRQVPCRPAPSAVAAGARYTLSAVEGLCRTAALESAAGLLCRPQGFCVGRGRAVSDGGAWAGRRRLPQGMGKKTPAPQRPSANLAN